MSLLASPAGLLSSLFRGMVGLASAIGSAVRSLPAQRGTMVQPPSPWPDRQWLRDLNDATLSDLGLDGQGGHRVRRSWDFVDTPDASETARQRVAYLDDQQSSSHRAVGP